MKSGNRKTHRIYWLYYAFFGGVWATVWVRSSTFGSDFRDPLEVVTIIGVFLGVCFIIGGVGLKYNREWARRLLDVSATIIILGGSALLGGRIREFASMNPSGVDFFWEARILELLFVWLPAIASGSLVRYQLWGQELLAACRTDATKFSPGTRKAILARMAVVSVAAGFAGYLIALAVSK